MRFISRNIECYEVLVRFKRDFSSEDEVVSVYSFGTENKAIKEALNEVKRQFKPLTIGYDSVYKISGTYRMDIQKFLEYAEKIDKKEN